MEMWCFRRTLRISWKDLRQFYASILQQFGVTWELRLLGHACRAGGLVRGAMLRKHQEKRPRIQYVVDLEDNMETTSRNSCSAP